MASFTFQPYYGASRGAFPACAYPYPQRSGRGRCGSNEGACGPSSCDRNQDSSLHPFFQFFKEVDNALNTANPSNDEETSNEKPQEANKVAKSNDKAAAPASAPARRHGHGHRRHTSTYTPRFDVREEADSFVLSGELPGIARENINIEFTDAHTLAVSGRTVREYSSGDQSLAPASSAAALADSPAATIEANDAPAAPAANDTDMTDHTDAASANYRPASVEDEDFVDVGSDKPAASSPAPEAAADTSNDASTAAPATAGPESTPAAAAAAAAATSSENAAPKARYWVSERSVGTFRRSFTFTGEVDHEQVHASLRDGLLNIVVPKKARSVQRIAIE